MVSAFLTLFIISTAYEAQTVATYRHSGWPAASIPAVFFFQRLWMIRCTFPGGLNVGLAPYGVGPGGGVVGGFRNVQAAGGAEHDRARASGLHHQLHHKG